MFRIDFMAFAVQQINTIKSDYYLSLTLPMPFDIQKEVTEKSLL